MAAQKVVGPAPIQHVELDALLDADVVTKCEVAGRKIIFYLDGLTRGQERTFDFQIRARFPVRALIPDSQAYSYYEPEVRAEAEGSAITVGDPAP